MFKFIHAADLHLDSPLKGLERYEGAPADEIRDATRGALRNLVELAIREQVQLVVIAGDIYDGDWPDHNTGLHFVGRMSQLRTAGIPVVMIRGNHDAANKMTQSLPLPDNVTVLSHTEAETATTARLAELGVAIHGRSFANAAETENLVRDYPARKPGMFNIGLLHTSLEGNSEHATYAPCTLDDLLRQGYDYWALGHIHKRAIVHEQPPIVYSGNVQGRHIRETGAKGCYLVTVDDDGKCELQFQPLDVFRWEICTVDAEGAEDPKEVLARFSTEFERVLQRNPELPIAVRVILSGRCAAHQQLLADQQAWTNQVRALALDASGGSAWVEKVRFDTSPPRAVDAEWLSDGPIGEIVSYLREVSADDQQLRQLAEELSDFSRKLPAELVGGEDGLGLNDPATLRRYLVEVEPMLLGRLNAGAEP